MNGKVLFTNHVITKVFVHQRISVNVFWTINFVSQNVAVKCTASTNTLAASARQLVNATKTWTWWATVDLKAKMIDGITSVAFVLCTTENAIQIGALAVVVNKIPVRPISEPYWASPRAQSTSPPATKRHQSTPQTSWASCNARVWTQGSTFRQRCLLHQAIFVDR